MVAVTVAVEAVVLAVYGEQVKMEQSVLSGPDHHAASHQHALAHLNF
jgi:hypothetical protein